jgi:hypothetical protein
MKKSYVIYNNKSRTTIRDTFPTYEKARQEVRKAIRRKFDSGTEYENAVQLGMWDRVSRNPTAYTELGYQIIPIWTP